MNWFSYVEKYCTECDFTLFAMAGKKPLEKIKPLFDKDRSIEELNKFNWTNPAVSGIGVIIRKCLLCFDFDEVKDFAIVKLFLSELGLDTFYKWIVKSGSGSGYHVYVNVWCKDLLIKEFGDKAYYFFYPIAPGSVKRIEMRLKRCYVVLPPSIHTDTKLPYEFLNGFPDEKPSFVNETNIIEFFNKYFILNGKIKKQKTSSSTSKNKIATPSNDTKHLNAAIDFIKNDKFDYQVWNKLGFALASLGEKGRSYFHRLSKNEFWTTPDDRINQEYDHCLKAYDSTKSNLGTLFQYAMDNGFKHPGKKNNFSKIFYEFKLSVLQLPEEGLLIKIMNYSMFRKAIEEEKLTTCKEIKAFIKSEFKTVLDTENYNVASKDYKALKKHTAKFEKKYGPDIYCRIGKEFFEDVLKNKFKLKHFRVRSALSGILGKTDLFKNIGKERLAYAMFGYKSSEIAKKFDVNVWMRISETTLKTLLSNLQSKNFFTRAYYSKWCFYSTRLSQEELERISSDWLKNRRKKILSTKTNKNFADLVRTKFREVDKEILGKSKKYPHLHYLAQVKDSVI